MAVAEQTVQPQQQQVPKTSTWFSSSSSAVPPAAASTPPPTTVVITTQEPPTATTANKQAAADPHRLLESMKRSANRELEYRMAVFNYNCERIQNGLSSPCGSVVELAPTSSGDQHESSNDNNNDIPTQGPPPTEESSITTTKTTPPPLPVGEDTPEETGAATATETDISQPLTVPAGLEAPSTQEPKQDDDDDDNVDEPKLSDPILLTRTSADDPVLVTRTSAADGDDDDDDLQVKGVSLSQDMEEIVASGETDDSSVVTDRKLQDKIERVLSS
eukprot:scaffold1165_cov147-Amphora_coffeaeformis.AAC.3